MRSSLWHPVHRWGEVEHSTILKSGCQFSCDDMLWTKKIAKLKIHVGNRPYRKIPYFHPVMNSINKLLYVCVMLVLHWYVNQNIKNCDWICKNRSYCPWQEVQFLPQTQRHINTLSSFTAKMKKSWVVCFCWLLLPSPLAIRTSSLGSSWSSGGKVEDWVSL